LKKCSKGRYFFLLRTGYKLFYNDKNGPFSFGEKMKLAKLIHACGFTEAGPLSFLEPERTGFFSVKGV